MKLKQMEATKVTVGGMEFYIKPFAAFKAANITGELASVLAPLLGALAPLASVKDGESLMDVDSGQAAEAISHCSNLDGDKLEKMTRKLLLGGNIAVEIEDDYGKKEQKVLDNDTANEIFCGNVQDMFVLCFHVIRLNFNGFFEKLAGLSGPAKSAKKTPRLII